MTLLHILDEQGRQKRRKTEAGVKGKEPVDESPQPEIDEVMNQYGKWREKMMEDDPEYFSSFISKDHFRTERWKMVARAKQWKTKMRKRHPGYFKMPEQERLKRKEARQKKVEQAKEQLRKAGYSQVLTAAQITEIVNRLLRKKIVGRRTLLSILRKR